MKYRHGVHIAHALSRLTVAAIGKELESLRDDRGVDMLAPVPMHFWRRWRRGYTQAALNAEELASLLRIALKTFAA